jgi:hypothetical protein
VRGAQLGQRLRLLAGDLKPSKNADRLAAGRRASSLAFLARP